MPIEKRIIQIQHLLDRYKADFSKNGQLMDSMLLLRVIFEILLWYWSRLQRFHFKFHCPALFTRFSFLWGSQLARSWLKFYQVDGSTQCPSKCLISAIKIWKIERLPAVTMDKIYDISTKYLESVGLLAKQCNYHRKQTQFRISWALPPLCS